MTYLCMKKRVTVSTGGACLSDVCQLSGKDAQHIGKAPLSISAEAGVYAVTPGDAASAALALRPDAQLSFSGETVCYVHVSPTGGRDILKPLRAAAALSVLFVGSALSILWFHTDVDMNGALIRLWQSVTGDAPPDALSVALPYALGLGLGVLFYYGFLSGGRAVSPLDTKLEESRTADEQTRAKRT